MEREQSRSWNQEGYSAVERFPELEPQFGCLQELLELFWKTIVKAGRTGGDEDMAQWRSVVLMFSLKAIKSATAVGRLVQDGFVEDANVLARSVIEAVANTCYLSKKPELIPWFLKHATVTRFKRMKAARDAAANGQWPGLAQPDPAQYDNIQKEYKQLVEEDPTQDKYHWPDNSLKCRMQAAGMGDVYEEEYEFLSSDVHGDMSAAQKYIGPHAHDETVLLPAPRFEELGLPLHVTVIFLLKQLEVFDLLFETGQEDRITALKSRTRTILGLMNRP